MTTTRPEADGIYAFNIEENYSQKHFVPGEYYSFAKDSDDPCTIVATRDGFFDVFKLSGGQLTRTATFKHYLGTSLRQIEALLVVRSRVYLQKVRDEGYSMVQVYSTSNGELLNTFSLPPTAGIASTNGRELFIGFNTASPSANDGHGPWVRAYSLDG